MAFNQLRAVCGFIVESMCTMNLRGGNRTRLVAVVLTKRYPVLNAKQVNLLSMSRQLNKGAAA
jgi:hypothetical protein